MLDIHKDTGPSPKIQFTHSVLPNYIDPANVSTKKYPFCAINSRHFVHTLDVLLPAELYALIQSHAESQSSSAPPSTSSNLSNLQDIFPPLKYTRVHLSLSDILTGEFFTQYFKIGNVVMRSEGRARVDNIFSVYEGVLRLELDRPTYERVGLQGRAVEDGGRLHQRGRYVITYDLRSPSALHGKKGFTRLEWAAKNVLTETLIWLFFDLSSSKSQTTSTTTAPTPEPIHAHAHTTLSNPPEIITVKEVATPALAPSNLSPTDISLSDLASPAGNMVFQERNLAVLEWLHLLSLDSPRLGAGDDIDAFLSRYSIPGWENGDEGDDGEDGKDAGKGKRRDFIRVRYHGFVPPRFIESIFLRLLQSIKELRKIAWDAEQKEKEKVEKEQWFAIIARGFGDGRWDGKRPAPGKPGGGGGGEGRAGGEDGYTILQFSGREGGRETGVWEAL